MTKWEYRFVRFADKWSDKKEEVYEVQVTDSSLDRLFLLAYRSYRSDKDVIIEYLNRLGAEGWEVFQVATFTDQDYLPNSVFRLKRAYE